MKNKILLLVLGAILNISCWSFSYSQNTKALSLKEAIELSLKNSNQLKGSTARIEEATAALKEAVERRLPDVNASASYLRLNSANVDLKVKTENAGSGGNGGNNATSSPNISQAAYGMVNASLPIYAGSRIKYGIESAKYLEEAEKLDAQNNREGVIINTIDAYNNLYKAKLAVDLVGESLQQAQQRVKEFSNLEKNGLLARNDLLKAELQFSNTQLSLLDAENNWKLANVNMNLILGLPDSIQLALDSASLQTNISITPLEDYVQQGLQNRKDLSALNYRRKAANTGIKAANAEKYPSIALSAGYVALDVPGFLTVTNAANVGIGLQYSLSSLWKTNAKVQQAKAREKQVEANEAILTDAITLQVNQAYQNYLLSVKKIDVYSTAVAQATENYKIVNNKYQNGLETVTDLLEADVAQLQAKLNYAFAKSDATVAYDKLLQSAGLLKDK